MWGLEERIGVFNFVCARHRYFLKQPLLEISAKWNALNNIT